MSAIRVIVADSSVADLYDLPARRAALKKIGSIVNADAARHDRESGGGAAGRIGNRTTGFRHALQARQTPRQLATERFIRRLARAAGVNAREPGVEGLVLVGSPRLLAAVKSQLPKAAMSRVIGEVRRNLVAAPALELRQQVQACLPPPPIR